MILGTVGSHPEGFQRLVDALDAAARRVDDEIVIQIGSTPRPPQQATHFRFLSNREFNERMMTADAVVCHAGIGSIVGALKLGKPVIVFPRLPSKGEVYDNHQVDTAEALARSGHVRVAYTADDVVDACNDPLVPPRSASGGGLPDAIRRFVLETTEGRT